MAKNILDELLLLVKQQVNLQENIVNQLLKTQGLLDISRKETNGKLKLMNKLMKNLPENKQKELKKIVRNICQHTEVEMVILFGSYARGDWVEEYEEDDIHFKYQSDFDLLIIVPESCKASEQKKLEQVIFKSIDDLSSINTPVSIIVHDIHFINCQLKKAQYFFSDIKKEGITLYDSGKFKLEKTIELDKKERYKLAKEDFEYWFSSASDFYEGFTFYFKNEKYNHAAFLLHQITERLYTCILLVFTRYKPKTHKLELLRKLTNALDKRLIKVFPLVSQEEINHFTLLCEAYIEARYNKNYTITHDELSWLSNKIKELTNLTESLCQEKINSFLNEAVKNSDQ